MSIEMSDRSRRPGQFTLAHKPLYLAINCLLEVRPRSVKTKEARGLNHYIVS
jgi:hypothetical protein